MASKLISFLLVLFCSILFSQATLTGSWSGTQEVYATSSGVCLSPATCPFSCTFSGNSINCVRPRCQVDPTHVLLPKSISGSFTYSNNQLVVTYSSLPSVCITFETDFLGTSADYTFDDNLLGSHFCPGLSYAPTCSLTSSLIVGHLKCDSGCTLNSGAIAAIVVPILVCFICCVGIGIFIFIRRRRSRYQSL